MTFAEQDERLARAGSGPKCAIHDERDTSGKCSCSSIVDELRAALAIVEAEHAGLRAAVRNAADAFAALEMPRAAAEYRAIADATEPT